MHHTLIAHDKTQMTSIIRAPLRWTLRVDGVFNPRIGNSLRIGCFRTRAPDIVFLQPYILANDRFAKLGPYDLDLTYQTPETRLFETLAEDVQDVLHRVAQGALQETLEFGMIHECSIGNVNGHGESGNPLGEPRTCSDFERISSFDVQINTSIAYERTEIEVRAIFSLVHDMPGNGSDRAAASGVDDSTFG